MAHPDITLANAHEYTGDNHPVLSFESSGLMGLKGEVPDEDYTIPLGLADVKREGADITVIATWRPSPLPSQ